MKSILNEEFLLKNKLRISIFVALIAFFALSTNLYASGPSYKVICYPNDLKVNYLLFDNIIFNLFENNIIETSNFTNIFSKLSQIQIPNSQINIEKITTENKAPLTTNIFPFLMMALGYFLWKIHKRFMNKNEK